MNEANLSPLFSGAPFDIASCSKVRRGGLGRSYSWTAFPALLLAWISSYTVGTSSGPGTIFTRAPAIGLHSLLKREESRSRFSGDRAPSKAFAKRPSHAIDGSNDLEPDCPRQLRDHRTTCCVTLSRPCLISGHEHRWLAFDHFAIHTCERIPFRLEHKPYFRAVMAEDVPLLPFHGICLQDPHL